MGQQRPTDPWSRFIRGSALFARTVQGGRGGGVVRGWRYFRRWLRGEVEPPPQ